MTHRGGLSLSIIIWRIGGGGRVFFCPGVQQFSWRPMGVAWVRILPRQGVWGAAPRNYRLFLLFLLLKFWRC